MVSTARHSKVDLFPCRNGAVCNLLDMFKFKTEPVKGIKKMFR